MIYIYIFTMALVTYLIRMIPLTLFRKKITNRYLRSFLCYVPYACLMAMTFPAVFYATTSPISALAGVLAGMILAFYNKGLMTVAMSSCAAVFIAERILALMI